MPSSGRDALAPRGQRAAGVIEVHVREHDDIDLLGRDVQRGERVEQHVTIFDDAEALAHRGLEERADAGLEQHGASAVLAHEQRAAGEVDAILLVGRAPALPHRARRVAEHRPAVEPLRVAGDRMQLHIDGLTTPLRSRARSGNT